MSTGNAPRSVDELREKLQKLPFFVSKISIEKSEKFFETIYYRDGGIGHMIYGPIEESLDNSEFEDFLSALGITDKMFCQVSRCILCLFR